MAGERLISRLTRLWSDTRGTVGLEFSIVVAGLAAGAVAAAYLLGPALHAYADHLSQVADHAEAVLTQMNTTGS